MGSMSETPNPEPSKTTGVGYGRPPEETRFKPGASGNPRGRPRGTLSIATVLERTLRERVVIQENGRCKKVTKLEAAVAQLVNRAIAGEPRAVQLMTALLRSAEERAVETTAPTSDLEEADQKVLLGVLKRLDTAGLQIEGGSDVPKPD